MISLKFISTAFKKRASKIDKRFRLVISALLLTFIMLASTFFSFDAVYIFVPILAIFSYLLTYFCILEDIEHIGWFGFFFMPMAISISLYLVYFLFPGRWLTRIPFISLYGISIYAVLLTSNIFNVGVEKSLQLYRAAFSVNYFYQAFVAFLSMNFLMALQQTPFVNMIGTGIIIFLLAFHLLWTIRLKRYIESDVLKYSFFISLIISQAALIISFIPLRQAISSLFIASLYYGLIGMIYHHLDSRLFKETVREYVIVLIFVVTITILSISW